MDTTRQSTPEEERAEPAAGWGVLVAYHADAARVGARLVVTTETPIAIGRGEGVFDDHTLSRRHARIAVGPGGLEIADQGSRNGTFVNGEPVKRQVLRPGDVIGVGELLLLVLRHASAENDPSAVLGRELARVGPLATPVLFVGETGAGKSHYARLLHEHSGRGALVVLPCGAAAPDKVSEELFGLDPAAYPPGRPGLLEQADRGTLLLDDVDDAPPGLQAALLAFLDDGHARRQGAPAAVAVDVRVAATARSTTALREEFLARLSRYVLRVPALRERPEDIPVLVRTLLAAQGRWARRALMQALLRHDYPHNVRELTALIERAVIDAGDQPLVGVSRGVVEALGLADEGAPTALAVAADGTWFRPPGAPRVSLAKRDNLARILRALIEAREREPGRALATDALFEVGWPGEKIQTPSASGRVYVALSSLRNLGLREFLVRQEGGYMLDAAAQVEKVG